MAQNQSPAFFAVALLLLAAATPLALAQAPPALPIVGSVLNAITINAHSAAPSPEAAPADGLVGIPVTLVCNILGVNVNVGQAVTGITGGFSITIGNLLNTLLSPVAAVLGGTLPCTVNVDLPLSDAVCPALNLTSSVHA